MYMFMCVYIYIYIHMCVYIYIYMYSSLLSLRRLPKTAPDLSRRRAGRRENSGWFPSWPAKVAEDSPEYICC